MLVAGPDFGTGSSREHAVWALMDYGFRSLSRLDSPTFFGAMRQGKAVLAAEVAQDDVELLWKLIEQHPGMEITVNLQDRNVAAGTVLLPFKIDDYTAWRLLEGLDDIGLTLRKLDKSSLTNRVADVENRTRCQPDSVEAAEIGPFNPVLHPLCQRPRAASGLPKFHQLRLKLRVALGNQW